MRKIRAFRCLAIILAAVCAAFTLSVCLPGQEVLQVRADNEWSEEYYRASDPTGDLSELQMENLDEDCIRFMRDFHADIALLAVTSDSYEGMTPEELAEGYYDSCGFGYGEGRDGFQRVFYTDTGEMRIVAFGAAEGMIPADYLRMVEEKAPAFREDHGVFGTMYVTIAFLRNYLEGKAEAEAAAGAPAGAAAEAGEGAAAETDEEIGEQIEEDIAEEIAAGADAAGSSSDGSEDPYARVGEGADLPAWYPVHPGQFPEYHDETAPRVVDTADIFTGEEEAAMEARLAEIREELDRDIVIFTDVSTYGMNIESYSEDFFDYNGYGIGDDYEGVELCICMDPADRGWWTTCTGPQSEKMYTEEIANQVDDMLYEYLAAGEYYEGVSDWIENIRRLYKSGSPYTPEWAMQDKTAFERSHDPQALRIVDDAGLLTEEEITKLTAQAKEISDRFGLDVVVYTAEMPSSIDRQALSDDFYYYNGYGFGDDYDGILLTVYKWPGYKAVGRISASGKGAAKLTDVNRKRLLSRCEALISNRRYYDGISGWMDQAAHMLKTGRAPLSKGTWILYAAVSVLAGSIFGGISLSRANKRMATPKIAENADKYFVNGSLSVRNVSDQYLSSTSSRTYSPVQKRSSGGSSHSSGRRSSYSGSHRGSSGRSHTGSGRKF